MWGKNVFYFKTLEERCNLFLNQLTAEKWWGPFPPRNPPFCLDEMVLPVHQCSAAALAEDNKNRKHQQIFWQTVIGTSLIWKYENVWFPSELSRGASSWRVNQKSIYNSRQIENWSYTKHINGMNVKEPAPKQFCLSWIYQNNHREKSCLARKSPKTKDSGLRTDLIQWLNTTFNSECKPVK